MLGSPCSASQFFLRSSVDSQVFAIDCTTLHSSQSDPHKYAGVKAVQGSPRRQHPPQHPDLHKKLSGLYGSRRSKRLLAFQRQRQKAIGNTAALQFRNALATVGPEGLGQSNNQA